MAFHMSPMAVRTTIGSKNRRDGESGSPRRCPVTVQTITAFNNRSLPSIREERSWSAPLRSGCSLLLVAANHHPEFSLGAMHDGIASKRKRLEVIL